MLAASSESVTDRFCTFWSQLSNTAAVKYCSVKQCCNPRSSVRTVGTGAVRGTEAERSFCLGFLNLICTRTRNSLVVDLLLDLMTIHLSGKRISSFLLAIYWEIDQMVVETQLQAGSGYRIWAKTNKSILWESVGQMEFSVKNSVYFSIIRRLHTTQTLYQVCVCRPCHQYIPMYVSVVRPAFKHLVAHDCLWEREGVLVIQMREQQVSQDKHTPLSASNLPGFQTVSAQRLCIILQKDFLSISTLAPRGSQELYFLKDLLPLAWSFLQVFHFRTTSGA